jgi:hypothetical protein
MSRIGKCSEHSAVRERDGTSQSGVRGHLPPNMVGDIKRSTVTAHLVATCDAVPPRRNAVSNDRVSFQMITAR